MDKAFLMTIGDELLIGQIIDTNSAWMGQQLNDIGIDIVEKLAVSDDKDAIIAGLERGLAKADLILITGGLGPTKDDITKHALTEYLGTKLVFSQSTYDKIVRFFERINRPMSDSHRIQCFLPESATLLTNRMGTAPGMLFYLDGKMIISMPGVPYEMQAIMNDEVLPKLLAQSQTVIYHKTLMTAGMGETDIEDAITPIVNQFPAHIKIAYLPSLASVRLRLTGRGTNGTILKTEVDQWVAQIHRIIPKAVYGFDNANLEQSLLNVFVKHGLTLSTAESCTGGYIAHRITSVPGSSAYFQGSVVSYSNDIKSSLLKVASTTLNLYGAVSEETVKEMVSGVLSIMKTNIAVSVSGIAGPDGGTPDKPVGTIFIAVSNNTKIEVFKINGTKDRLKNIEYTANVAMNKIRIFVEENYGK